jgi:Zn-dependent protease
MVAAGPLVNLATGPIFLWLAFHAQGAAWQPVWFFFALMASFSLLVAAFNLVPFRSATGSYSDGARILQLLTNSPVVAVQRAARRLQPA